MDNEFCRLLYDKLNPEERIFKFKSAELDLNTLIVVFLVKSHDYDEILDDRLRDKVQTTANSITPSDVNTVVRFTKCYADESSVSNKIIEYVFREHKSVYPILAGAKHGFITEGDFCTITFTLEKYVCEYVRGINLAQELKEYLDTEFIEEIDVVFIETPNVETAEVLPEKFFVATTRIIDATPTKIYAKGNFSHPKYICDVVEKEKEDVSLTVCGVISDIKVRTITKKDKSDSVNEKELYTFLLNDTTEKLRCKFFARPRKEFLWSSVFVDNANLIMNGTYKYDSFDNRFCFVANSVAVGDINFESINKKSNYNVDYGRYMYVVPEEYNDVAQNDMFDLDMTDLTLFENSKYVVFDLETTGLSIEDDEIIELAAIKIINGQFTEKFSTFVKPSAYISKRITELTGISEDMVIDAPTKEQVIPDFYRFCKDCILVGHNIGGFDIPLLNTQANKVKYDFNNDFIDTLPMSKQKLKGIKKHKLGDVCSALKIPLEGAHRAINDVAANAQAFLKLMKM